MRRLLLFVLMCWPFLFAGSICNVVVGQKVVTGPPTPQAYYSFEQNLNDSINGNNLSGGSPSYSTSGVCAGTYALIADDETMRSNANLSANFPGKSSYSTPAFTLFAKVRSGSFSGTVYSIAMLSEDIYTASYEFYIEGATGKLTLILVNNSHTSYTAISTNALSTDTDYFVAGVWSGTDIKIYIGTSYSNIAQTGSTVNTTGSLHQLSNSSFGVGCIPGYGAMDPINIDCLSVFDRALSLSELQALAENP